MKRRDDGAAPADHEVGPNPSIPVRLIHEAARLFAESGFEGTSVAEIVKAAGVTKGAMYHYFASKDELLYEVYARVLRMQMQRLEAIASGPGSSVDRIRAAAADVAETSIRNIDDTLIFWRSLHQLAGPQQDAVRLERRKYHVRFRRLLFEAIEAREIRDDISTDIIINYFFGAVHHVTMWYKPHLDMTPEQVAAQFAELLMSSISLDPTDRTSPLS